MNSLPVWPTGSMELWHKFGFALRVTKHHQCTAAGFQHAHQSIVSFPPQLMNSELRLDSHFTSLVNKSEVGLCHTFLLQLPVNQRLKI